MTFRSLELADSATMIAIIKQQFIPAVPGDDSRCSADLAGSLATLQTAGANAADMPASSHEQHVGGTRIKARENALNSKDQSFPHGEGDSRNER
jgi:hypothetical protein